MLSIALALSAHAARLAKVFPVAGPVAGRAKTFQVNKRLSKQDSVSVHALPVIAQPPQVRRQDEGRQMRHLDPRQNQKANVVRDEAQALELELLRPTDERLTVTALQRGRSPAQERKPLRIRLGNIPHAIPEIMKASHRCTPARDLSPADRSNDNTSQSHFA